MALIDHATSQVGTILKIWNFWLHNRILHPKISLNARLQLFIPFNREVINIWLILGVFWAYMDHAMSQVGPILKIWNFWLHNRILHPKISLNDRIQVFIPFNREVINIWLILGVFSAYMDHATSQMGPNFEDLKFRLHNRILHPKISLNEKFQLFIPFNREVINIWLILGVFWA